MTTVAHELIAEEGGGQSPVEVKIVGRLESGNLGVDGEHVAVRIVVYGRLDGREEVRHVEVCSILLLQRDYSQLLAVHTDRAGLHTRAVAHFGHTETKTSQALGDVAG